MNCLPERLYEFIKFTFQQQPVRVSASSYLTTGHQQTCRSLPEWKWPLSVVLSLSPFQRKLFLFGCAGSSLLCTGSSSCSTLASHFGDFFWCSSRALEHGLSSCSSQAKLLCSMWNLPGLAIGPMSPALVGRFLTAGPPGKSCHSLMLSVLEHLFICLR